MKKEKGTILIICLWILVILSLLAITLGFFISLEIKIAKLNYNRTKAVHLAEAAIKKGIAQLKKDIVLAYHYLAQSWSNGYLRETGEYIFKEAKLGDGQFSLKYEFSKDGFGQATLFYGMEDEERKINLNLAPQNILKELLFACGIATTNDEAEVLARSICAWRGDSLSEEYLRQEEEYYSSLENPYHLKAKPFKSLEELILVHHMDEDKFTLLKRFVSVYAAKNVTKLQVNLNTACREVLMAVGIDAPIAGEIINYRAGPDARQGTDDDNYFDSCKGEGGNDFVVVLNSILAKYGLPPLPPDNFYEYGTVTSSCFRINAYASVSQSQAHLECIVDISDGKGVKYLYWHQN